MKEIIDFLKKKILLECEKIGKNEELLGIEIDYYYDGEIINLSTSIKFFKENFELISKGESRNEYISLINNDNIDKLIKDVCSLNNLDMNKRDEITKFLAKDLYEALNKIKWNNIGKIAEEFYIDFLLNYD
ncbi:hypothetical protein [Clostridium sp.]|uniref:hypothetical protein n=1 Tax=Clostridium sp. TaxID=1506 RepID=UPI0026177576|nr:hypothetical protein [Clostridium sp.]